MRQFNDVKRAVVPFPSFRRKPESILLFEYGMKSTGVPAFAGTTAIRHVQ